MQISSRAPKWISMVFDSFGPLVKRCDGFDTSSWSSRLHASDPHVIIMSKLLATRLTHQLPMISSYCPRPFLSENFCNQVCLQFKGAARQGGSRCGAQLERRWAAPVGFLCTTWGENSVKTEDAPWGAFSHLRIRKEGAQSWCRPSSPQVESKSY